VGVAEGKGSAVALGDVSASGEVCVSETSVVAPDAHPVSSKVDTVKNDIAV